MYSVFYYYENPFGDRLYVSDSPEDAREFAEMFIEETDGECILQIRGDNGKEV